MIRVDNLTRKYGPTTAVDHISFEISGREVVGFLGPNGAGKTTTLKVLAGFLYPTEGSVHIADRDVGEDALECRRLIGYLPENNPLYEEMEVWEYLDWAARVRGLEGGARSAALRRVIERCGLTSVIAKDIGQLSKGFRQRVGLAAAMVHDPPILLLDEPTSGLDPNQALEVRELISELRKEKTVLYSSHILSEVRASCDRVIIIHQGKIAAQGRPEELTEQTAQEQKIHLVLRAGRGYAPGTAGKEYDLSRGAAVDPQDVSSELSGIEGILSVLPNDSHEGELAFQLAMSTSVGDLREQVFKLAVKKKWPVLELRRETMSLEDVFRSLTA